MARMIDADDLKAIRFHDLPYSQIVPTDCDTDDKVSAYKLGWNDAIDAIVESASTVDAVEVLRCKDCKYYIADGCDECELMSAKSIIATIKNKRWYSDFYCAWGERREDDSK